MSEDAPVKGNNHGGFRRGAGRPAGSRNRPKKKKASTAMVSAPTRTPTSSSPAEPPTTSTKRKSLGEIPSASKPTGPRIANFWATRAPQGTHAMTANDAADLAPDTPNSAAAAVARLHIDMQTAAPSEPINERVLDESIEDSGDDDVGAALLDDEVDGGDEDDEGNLDTEQQSAEAAANSVNDQWLATTLEKVQKEIQTHGQPRVYREGQLWIYPKDPIFALQEAATTGVYSPDTLYLLPIFLWLPDYLPGHPDRFYCECGEALNKHSYNTNPIARRVCTTSGSDYFLLTKRHYCPQREGNTRGCGRTYQGTDPWILGQLPRFVQDRFPVAISHRSALDISQMDMMKITFAGRFGADPFSKMVCELKYLRHSRLEAMYLHAALHYGLRGTVKIPPFSAFKNRTGFAGYTPSTKYLKSMFISWILKADHTFKTVDHQGRLPGGEPIHTALYNAVNDAEEVRFYALTLTQGFAPLQGMYERVQTELVRHAHGPTEVIYTDNPRHERNWHETVTPSLKQNVKHIVVDPFRDLAEFKLSGLPIFASSPDRIDTICDSILQTLLPNDSIYIALSIGLHGDMIRSIQLREKSSTYVFDVASHVPLALKSVLTHPRIVKFGHEITASARRLSSTWQLSIPASSLVDLGKLAKLKGAAADANCSLATLCGAVLNLRLHEPNPTTPPAPITSQVDDLACQVDCAWSIQAALMRLGTVGIPLQPSQLRPAQLVALVIGNKTQAWGELVEHDGYLVIPNTQGKVSVTPAYSVIKLTKVFVPGFIVAKHGQMLEWLETNGSHAVVQTRTLRSRAPEPPHPATESAHDHDLGTPAPIVIPSVAEQLAQDPPTHQDDVSRAVDLPPDIDTASDADTDIEIMDECPEPTADSIKILPLDSGQHSPNILHQPQTAETLATRVLDDAYHFMDRLLRLLSKKHPAYKEFAHLFSETIFIRHGEDETKVREILKQKGINWDYAIRAKKAALHRRIRRYIPAPEKLVRDLLVLFSCFQDIRDADGKKFFSKEARKQAAALIETARLGFLSDPPGLAVYYWIGCDKNGLKLYRTVRGTNSVEGGVHKQIRRIFGSLHASAGLTEAILGNWFHRRNRRIGHYNRTGKKWNKHFDIWLLDEIVETAIRLDVKPTFPEPRLLATRIATSETFGIIPITPQLAHANDIAILPSPNILAAPHHDDNHRFTLTQFSTKPVNLYRYLQLRQRTTAPVIPVHTQREFELFQANIAAFIPLNTAATAEKIYKVTKYDEFARFWNRQVATQSPTELESSKRLYYKLPEQLERHHKKSIQWKTTRATLNIGGNVTALEPIRQLIRDSSRTAVVLPAITHEPIEVDYSADPLVGVDLSSFNPMAMRQQSDARRTIQAAIAAIPDLEPLVQLEVPTLPQSAPQQTILAFTSATQDGNYESSELARPAKKVRSVPEQVNAKTKRSARRCALCAHAKCGHELSCNGKGGREKCEHKSQTSHRELGFDAATRRRHRTKASELRASAVRITLVLRQFGRQDEVGEGRLPGAREGRGEELIGRLGFESELGGSAGGLLRGSRGRLRVSGEDGGDECVLRVGKGISGPVVALTKSQMNTFSTSSTAECFVSGLGGGVHGGLDSTDKLAGHRGGNGTETYLTGSERLESAGTLCSARATSSDRRSLGHVTVTLRRRFGQARKLVLRGPISGS
ncbi:hypothetical protein C8F01DRAFT_1228372 [Mycena amicta]|nr:hypothetical protein C8F01DRAFT_1228372 [Mycena amicta]